MQNSATANMAKREIRMDNGAGTVTGQRTWDTEPPHSRIIVTGADPDITTIAKNHDHQKIMTEKCHITAGFINSFHTFNRSSDVSM